MAIVSYGTNFPGDPVVDMVRLQLAKVLENEGIGRAH
jgi:hypothetical protein